MKTAPSTDLLRLVNGYQVSQAIHVAAALGVADHLAGKARSSDDLARLTQSHPATLYRLLRALAAAGVFHESDDSTFSLTPMGECLRSNSPTPVGGWAAFVGRPYVWQAWSHLLHSVRAGDNAFRDLHKQSVWDFRASHPDENAIFNHAMTANSRGAIKAAIDAYDFGKFRHVADIGGGQGQLLANILTAHPGLRATLFDQPHVVARAHEVLSEHGVGDRCEIVAGSFFDSIPEHADAYILQQIIHDWDDDEALTILKGCRRAMKADAKLLLIERIVEPPNQGTLGKFMDLHMLVVPGGRERSYDEFLALCRKADFGLPKALPAGPYHHVIEAEPR